MSLALVMGANGAIGRHAVAHLKQVGWTVGGLGHGPVTWVGECSIDCWTAGDVSPENLDVLSERLGTPDLVINLAGGSAVGPSLSMPLGDFDRNVTATMRLLNWMLTNSPAARLVAVSSAAVYGDRHSAPISEDSTLFPLSPYGHHKLMMEQAVQYWGEIFGIRSVIVRPFSVFGVGLQKQLVFDLCSRLSKAPPTLVLSGTGAEMRDWISIQETARLIVSLADYASAEAPVFNLCTGYGRTVSELASLIAQVWGHQTRIEFDGVSRRGDPRYLVGSIARLQSVGLQSQVSLQEELASVVGAARRALIER